MAHSNNHPKYVPCPECSATVERESKEVNIKVKGGNIKIMNVPQYQCDCGLLFIPHETQVLISDIQKDKRLKLNKDITVSYQELSKKGKRILKD
ncbi:MAG: YgiT-type zinc finger protein [Clostridia bacterium]